MKHARHPPISAALAAEGGLGPGRCTGALFWKPDCVEATCCLSPWLTACRRSAGPGSAVRRQRSSAGLGFQLCQLPPSSSVTLASFWTSLSFGFLIWKVGINLVSLRSGNFSNIQA